MKYSAIILVLICLSLSTAKADTWIDFHSSNPANPQITVIESDNLHVKYRITVPGMYVEDVVEDDETFQKIRFPESTLDTQSGLPGLPRISVNLAIPASANLDISTSKGREILLTNYWVAPIPEITFIPDSVAGTTTIERYVKDLDIYNQTTYYPSNTEVERERGLFITQQVAGLNVYPICFNPSTKTISIHDTITVNVQFQDGSGATFQELGIFAEVARNSLLNYTAFGTTPPPGPGTVRWLDAREPTLIECDYLIVIPDQLWTNQTGNEDFIPQVQRFAELRASLSGYDICIVRASHLPPGQEPDGTIPRGRVDPFIPEGGRYAYEGIRDYVRQVFLQGHARHTGSGKLGFLLLIGNPRPHTNEYIGIDDWIIPSPRDNEFHSPRAAGGDGYYARLTVNEMGAFDSYEDIAVGRFLVQNGSALQNVVDKMVAYSITPGDRSWKNNALNVAVFDDNVESCRNYLTTASERLHAHGITVNYAHQYPISPLLPEPYYDTEQQLTVEGNRVSQADTAWVNAVLRTGTGLVGIVGHGTSNWAIGYRVYEPSAIFPTQVSNHDRLHFVMSFSCESAYADACTYERTHEVNHPSGTCCAERMLSTALSGAIGFVGASRAVYSGGDDLVMYDIMTLSILDNHCRAVGIAYLSYKNSPLANEEHKKVFYYIGDPALDYYSEPRYSDITEDETWSGRVTIAQSMSVLSGATLTVLPGTRVVLLNGAELTIHGRLIAQGQPANRIRIDGEINQVGGRIKLLNSNGETPWNTLRYCDFDRFDVGIQSDNSNVSIESCNIGASAHSLICNSGLLELSGTNQLNNVLVNAGVLYLSEGTELSITPSRQIVVGNAASLSINGALTEPVRISCSDANGTWRGIYLSSTGNTFNNCVFENASIGIRALSGSSVSLTSCSFNNCASAVCAINANVQLEGCDIINRGQYGILATAGATVNMTRGSITGALRSGVWVHGYSNVILDGVLIHDNGDDTDPTLFNGGIRNTYGSMRLHCIQSYDNYGPGLSAFGGFTDMAPASGTTGKNTFLNNRPADGMTRAQIYFDNAQFNLCNGRNKICGPDGWQIMDATPSYHDVTNNHWCDQTQNLHPAEYENRQHDSAPQTDRCALNNLGYCMPTMAAELFQEAWEQENTMLYELAIVNYDYILKNYPGEPEAKLCPDRIIACDKALQQDLSERRSYFLAIADTTGDPGLEFEARSSAAWCLVEMNSFGDAEQEFIELLDEADDNYKAQKLTLLELMTELKASAWDTIGALDEAVDEDRMMSIINRMESILTTPEIDRVSEVVPTTYMLYQNYPNPFNPVTEIRFDLPERADVELRVFNLLGQEAALIAHGSLEAGSHAVRFDGSRLASGVYIYSLKANGYRSDKKMVLLK